MKKHQNIWTKNAFTPIVYYELVLNKKHGK